MVPELLIFAWWQIFPLTCHRDAHLSLWEQKNLQWWLRYLSKTLCYKPSRAAGTWAQKLAPTRSPGQAATIEFTELSFSRISPQSHLTQLIPKSKAKQKWFPLQDTKSWLYKMERWEHQENKKRNPDSPGHKKESYEAISKHTIKIFPNPDFVKTVSSSYPRSLSWCFQF